MSHEDEEMDCEEFDTGFGFSVDFGAMKQGAEAKLTESVYLGRNAIIKERFQKTYRHPTLDTRLNKARTKSELRGIVKAKELGVATPTIYLVDGERNMIVMERVNGPTAKQWIEEQRIGRSLEEFQKIIFEFGVIMGKFIGKMHCGGLIHGDLTTSNVLLRNSDPTLPVFIDFGLSSQGKVTAEEKGVDLYVLERAIASTHMESERLTSGILEGYNSAGEKQAVAVGKKLDEIRQRGRKRDMIG